MTVHIVGSGIASLAAAAYSILYKVAAPGDINIYEAEPDVGGAMVISTVGVESWGRETSEESLCNARSTSAGERVSVLFRLLFEFLLR